MKKSILLLSVLVLLPLQQVLAGGSDVDNATNPEPASLATQLGMMTYVFKTEGSRIQSLREDLKNNSSRMNCLNIKVHIQSTALMFDAIGSANFADKSDESRVLTDAQSKKAAMGLDNYYKALQLSHKYCRSAKDADYYLKLAQINANALYSVLRSL